MPGRIAELEAALDLGRQLALAVEHLHSDALSLAVNAGTELWRRLWHAGELSGGMLSWRHELRDPVVLRFRSLLVRLRLLGMGAYGASVLAHDVAVNVGDSASSLPDVKLAEVDAPALNGQWDEGWHTSGIGFDYVSNLYVHSSFFTLMAIDEITQAIENALDDANHISVYATGYGSEGLHLVHRTYENTDGAVVIRPLSAVPHVLAFCFDGQKF